jgi:TorA maturation chaperone TorD
MSWIDRKRREEKKLQQFFSRHVVPAAEALRARGVEFFPMGPDAERESWYEDGPSDQPDLFQYESAQAAEKLAAHWASQDLPEVEALAQPLLELARMLEVKEEDSEDLSSFVYVMY